MDGALHESYGKNYKAIKRDRSDNVSHWVGSVLTIKRIFSGNLFLLKVTRKEKLSSNSLREALNRS